MNVVTIFLTQFARPGVYFINCFAPYAQLLRSFLEAQSALCAMRSTLIELSLYTNKYISVKLLCAFLHLHYKPPGQPIEQSLPIAALTHPCAFRAPAKLKHPHKNVLYFPCTNDGVIIKRSYTVNTLYCPEKNQKDHSTNGDYYKIYF